jgi:hypothetical protein
MLNQHTFYHQRIKYSFHYDRNRIKPFENQIDTLHKLEKYFQKVLNGQIPNHIFNKPKYPRVSQFKIKGIKKAFLSSWSKKLIRDNKIEKLDSENNLSQCAQKVYETFRKNRINRKPGHDPILKNILIKDKNSIAIEVPVWKKIDGIYLTGHIDLIQIKKKTLKVIDYKPEGNFLYSLPQVATYGFLIKSKFNLKNLKCISFNKKEAWEYNPEILTTDIKKYLEGRNYQNREWERFI